MQFGSVSGGFRIVSDTLVSTCDVHYNVVNVGIKNRMHNLYEFLCGTVRGSKKRLHYFVFHAKLTALTFHTRCCQRKR